MNGVPQGEREPLVASRHATLVSAAVFDAVNGIEPRYEPVHVAANAPRGASLRSAVVHTGAAGKIHVAFSKELTAPRRILDEVGTNDRPWTAQPPRKTRSFALRPVMAKVVLFA